MKGNSLGLFTRSTFEGIGFTAIFVLVACASDFGTHWVSDATANAGPFVEPLAIDTAALVDAPVAVGPVTDAIWIDDTVATIPRAFDLRGPLMRQYDTEVDKRPTPAHSAARYYARADF